MKSYSRQPEKQSRVTQYVSKASQQAPASEILQAYRDGTLGKQPIQRESVEEEELMQGKFDTAQREEIDEDELLQGKLSLLGNAAQHEEIAPSEGGGSNKTGLSDDLKTGIENLSGYSMDDVKVHFNSDKPAQLNALAYAQGTDIHVAPGQEEHLPHEAWHVVQQKQGRVKPTMQLQGVNVNDNEGLEKEADEMRGKIIQRKLKIKSSKKLPFDKLTYKQYKSLKSRMVVPIHSWLLLRKMALSEEQFEYDNWRDAIGKAPEIGKTNPLIFAKTIYGMREDIVKERTNKDRNKQMLLELVDLYNQDKKEQGTKPHFKSPETKADKLLMFGVFIDNDLSEKFEIENVADDKKQVFPEFDSEVFTEWAEDHLNVFNDLYSTTLPIYDHEGLKSKIKDDRECRESIITATSSTTETSVIPSKPDKHIFLRSVVDGGNMLPAPDFAIIGKDSVVATSIQNGINEQEAKNLIAGEYGYEVENLCFVEQPDYHIDLMIMLLGGKNVMVKQSNNGTELKQTIEDLKSFNNPQLEVRVDEKEIAGKQTEDGKWEYNFFNGEYIIGKDKKLYYVTNGTVKQDAESKFREYMKKNANVEDVIFSSTINTDLLNTTHGGLGCRFKGAIS